MAPADDETSVLQKFLDKFKELMPDFEHAYREMTGNATALNNVFTQNRQRIQEIQNAIADTIPAIEKLGGTTNDAFNVLKDVSEATQRNVIASQEDAAKLYSINKVLDLSTNSLVKGFQDVGVQFSQIGPQMEHAINYVQNLGLNSKQVMGDVVRNMSLMNQFNFEGGVQGLTKMAANASILKFDMSETQRFADKVLDPDAAVAMASAFQRMGVASGELNDPFQLMNMSLNDPKGLQESLARMTKQYTEFDEKTKSFKISPMGILQMRELAKQTNMSYDNLAKSALAVANLDKALGELKPSINFQSEEDKQLLGSISKMNTQGEYEVNIKDEDGKIETKKLSDLTQEQVNLLIKQQKEKGELTMEELATEQLDAQKQIVSTLVSMRSGLEYGVVSADQVKKLSENIREFSTQSMNDIYNAVPKSSDIRPEVTKSVDNLSTLLKEFINNKGDMSGPESQAAIENIKLQITNLKNNATGGFETVAAKIEERAKKLIYDETRVKSKLPSGTLSASSKGLTQKVDFGGVVTFKVDAPPGTNKQDFENWLNSSDFKSKVYETFLNLDANQRQNLKKAGW